MKSKATTVSTYSDSLSPPRPPPHTPNRREARGVQTVRRVILDDRERQWCLYHPTPLMSFQALVWWQRKHCVTSAFSTLATDIDTILKCIM